MNAVLQFLKRPLSTRSKAVAIHAILLVFVPWGIWLHMRVGFYLWLMIFAVLFDCLLFVSTYRFARSKP